MQIATMSVRFTTHRFALQRVAAVKHYYQTSNVYEAARGIGQQFGIKQPEHTSVRDIVAKFEATGTVSQASGAGRPRSANTEDCRDALQRSLERSPLNATRRLGTELGV